MGFFAGVVKELDRIEDREERRKEFMATLLEKRKNVLIPELLEKIQDNNEKVSEIKERISLAKSFGFSEKTSMALEMSGQLEFELAKLEKIGKAKVSENYIRSLDTYISDNVTSDEKLVIGIQKGLELLKENMKPQDSLTALSKALSATTEEEFSESILGVNVKTPSFKTLPDFEYRSLGGSRIETSELSRMEKQIASSLETTFGGGYKLVGEGDLTYIKFDNDELNRLFTKLKDEAKKRVESATPGTGIGSPADVSLFIGSTLQNARRPDDLGQPKVATPMEIYNNLDSILSSPTNFDWNTLNTMDPLGNDDEDIDG